MSELPQVKLSRQQKMTGDELREFPSVELTDEKGLIGFLIIPPRIGGMTIFSAIQDDAEGAGVRSNSVLPPQVLEAASAPIVEEYPHLAKARATRRANLAARKEAVRV